MRAATDAFADLEHGPRLCLLDGEAGLEELDPNMKLVRGYVTKERWDGGELSPAERLVRDLKRLGKDPAVAIARVWHRRGDMVELVAQKRGDALAEVFAKLA